VAGQAARRAGRCRVGRCLGGPWAVRGPRPARRRGPRCHHDRHGDIRGDSRRGVVGRLRSRAAGAGPPPRLEPSASPSLGVGERGLDQPSPGGGVRACPPTPTVSPRAWTRTPPELKQARGLKNSPFQRRASCLPPTRPRLVTRPPVTATRTSSLSLPHCGGPRPEVTRGSGSRRSPVCRQSVGRRRVGGTAGRSAAGQVRGLDQACPGVSPGWPDSDPAGEPPRTGMRCRPPAVAFGSRSLSTPCSRFASHVSALTSAGRVSR
jgi:hypothetical protein